MWTLVGQLKRVAEVIRTQAEKHSPDCLESRSDQPHSPLVDFLSSLNVAGTFAGLSAEAAGPTDRPLVVG